MRYHLHESGGPRRGNPDIDTEKAEMGKKFTFDGTWTWSPIVPETVEACVHSLIKRIAWDKPAAPAICSWDGNLTYLQLDQLSSRLAYQLVDAGVVPGSRVILCFEKTCLAPVSMLAVMKAGGVSIALDMRQSQQYLSAITAHISTSILLSSPANEELARKLGEGKAIVVGHEFLSSMRSAFMPRYELPAVSPSDTVCEIYDVNENPGEPKPDKGVAVTHRNLSTAATYQQTTPGFTGSSRICDIDSYASHAAWYNFLVLTYGGCLCIPPTLEHQNNRHDLISALQSEYAVLSSNSVALLDNSELFRLVQLKYIAASVTPLGLGALCKNATTSGAPCSSEDGLVASIDPCPIPGQGTERVKTGRPRRDAANEYGVIHELPIIEKDRQISGDDDLINNPVEHEQNETFVFNLHKKEPTVHCEMVRSSDSSNGSPISSNGSAITHEEVMSPIEHEPSPHAIRPLSLLHSSVNREKIHAYAARLCHVKESQVLDIMPCTPLQEGLLALTARRPGDYVAKNVFEVANGIDLKRLRRAWDHVISMNPILRTRIVSLPHHGIMQVVLDEGGQWALGATLNDRQDADIGNGNDSMGIGKPLTRFAIFEGSTGAPCHFVWEIHHALYDGWSIPLLLSQAEQAYFNESCPSLEPMTAFIKYIIDRDVVAEKAFWHGQFANAKGSHFPSDKPGYHPKPESQIVKTVSGLNWGRGDFTPATVIRAAWSIAAANGAGSHEALFGVVVTGRQAPVPNIELIAGPTIATMPIRVDIDWDGSFKQLLDTVQRQSVEMIPFEQTGLQQISQISEQTAIGCRFQTLLVVQPGSEGSEAQCRPFLTESVNSQAGGQWQDFSTYPIVVECQLESDGVHIRIGFDSSLIGQQKMERIIHDFETSIKQLSSSDLDQEKLVVLARDYSGLEDIWVWNETAPPGDGDVRTRLDHPASPGNTAGPSHLLVGRRYVL
ncbi:NRPS [Arthroderma sp. PD_2]|nr:NRPS [Arthroderma sp. PD_2]